MGVVAFADTRLEGIMTLPQWLRWALVRGALVALVRTSMTSTGSVLNERRYNGALLGLLIVCASLCPAVAGDALWGTVTGVKSAEVVTLESDGRSYNIRIIGIEVPEQTAARAVELVTKLVRGKGAGIRFENRTADGEIVSRLFTEDPDSGKLLNVGLELVRAGLAYLGKDYEDKYGELFAAEAEARKAGRGIWAADRPKK